MATTEKRQADSSGDVPESSLARRVALWATVVALLVAIPQAVMAVWGLLNPTSTASAEALGVGEVGAETRGGAAGLGAAEHGAGASNEPGEMQPPWLTAPRDPGQFLGEVLGNILAGDDSDPEGVAIGPGRLQMREALLKVLHGQPSEVSVIRSPHPGTSGLYTLRVVDSEGRETQLGVRLLRRFDAQVPWEIDDLIVLPPSPRSEPTPAPGDGDGSQGDTPEE